MVSSVTAKSIRNVVPVFRCIRATWNMLLVPKHVETQATEELRHDEGTGSVCVETRWCGVWEWNGVGDQLEGHTVWCCSV